MCEAESENDIRNINKSNRNTELRKDKISLWNELILYCANSNSVAACISERTICISYKCF